jgi:hypothetical protein
MIRARYARSALLVVALAASLNARGDDGWQVRTVVLGESAPCDEAAASLVLRGLNETAICRHPIDLGPEPNTVFQGQWDCDASPADYYRLELEVRDCSGARSVPAHIGFPLPADVQKVINAMFETSGEGLAVKYLEHVTVWGMDRIVTASKGEDGTTITNASRSVLRPCSNDRSIEREFLVDDRWGDYGRSVTLGWPERLAELGPGESVLTEPGSRTVSIPTGPTRLVEPDGVRLKLRIEPALPSSVRVGDPPAGFVIPPPCDVVFASLPVPEGLRLSLD